MSATLQKNFMKKIKKESNAFHLMLLPGVIVTFLFAYIPLAGIVMAFQNFRPFLGFSGSDWVGFDNFRFLFSNPAFWNSMHNTVIIAIWKIALNILVPLALALLLNELGNRYLSRVFKRFTQTVVFIPFFFSWAILGGIIMQMFSYDSGVVNTIVVALGGDRTPWLISNDHMRTLIVATDVWKVMGYNTVIFLAAITNVDPGMYEAAKVDGAGHIRQLWSITLPTIMPIVLLMSILGMGAILNAGFEQILMLENSVVRPTVDIIDTFIFRTGLQGGQFSIGAAAGLFRSAISMGFVGVSYFIAYKVTDYRVF